MSPDSAPTPGQQPAPRGRRDRMLTVAGTFLPVPGALLLGWDVAPAIFLLWLDTLLCNIQFVLRFAPVIDWSGLWTAIRKPAERSARPAGRRPGIAATVLLAPLIAVAVLFVVLALGWLVLCVAGAVLFLTFPALGLGIALVTQVGGQYTHGLLDSLMTTDGLLPWIIADVLIRGYQVMQAAPASPENARARATEQYLLLYNRCAVLEALSLVSLWMGQSGLLLFLLLASAFVSYADTRDNWLDDLQAWSHARRRQAESTRRTHSNPRR